MALEHNGRIYRPTLCIVAVLFAKEDRHGVTQPMLANLGEQYWNQRWIVFDLVSGDFTVHVEGMDPIVLFNAKRTARRYIKGKHTKQEKTPKWFHRKKKRPIILFYRLHKDILIGPCRRCAKYEAVAAVVDIVRLFFPPFHKDVPLTLSREWLRVAKLEELEKANVTVEIRDEEALSQFDYHDSVASVLMAAFSPLKLRGHVCINCGGQEETVRIKRIRSSTGKFEVLERSPFIDCPLRLRKRSDAKFDLLVWRGRQ